MPDTGIWSAIATSFATFSSFLLMLIQRQNFAESIRPELVLIGWTRSVEGEGNAAHDVIAFQTIKNVGRGAAFNIMLGLKVISDNSFDTPHEPLEAMFGTTRLPILAVNETNDLNNKIIVWWKNVKPDHTGSKFQVIKIVIYCWDSRGARHDTRYNLFAEELSRMVSYDAIAPGVLLINRKTTTPPNWWLKMQYRLKRIPLLGRLFIRR